MQKDRRGNYFEDFHLGQVLQHGTPRTVTEGDASVYIALTGARQLLHSASTAAQLMGLERRPLDDVLVFNIAFGKTVPDISLNAVANLGYAEVRFHEPVFAGDTLRCDSVVIGLKENSNRKTGVVYVRSTCCNQAGRNVLSWVRWVMVNKLDPAAKVGGAHIPALQSSVQMDELAASCRIETRDAIDEWCELSGAEDLWDDYVAGEVIVHPLGMTIEDADHMSATRLYQNNAKPHFDALHMANSHVRRRLVYGGHVISVCRALSYDGMENVAGILAVNGGAHVAPTVAGDTLYARTEVLEKQKLPGRSDMGALRIRTLGLRNYAADRPLDFRAAAEANTAERAHVVLDLDYVVAIPRQPLGR